MKPFYIESDEEVTSVIDRLRASSQEKNIFVVPSGAILLQSAVNMRLLLREAQKAQKDFAIVTSDEYGQILAQKVGITTYAGLDEIEDFTQDEELPTQPTQGDSIGSSSYYEMQTHGMQDTHNKGNNSDVNLDVGDVVSMQESVTPANQNITEQSASIQKAAEDFENIQRQTNATHTVVHGTVDGAMDMRPLQQTQPQQRVTQPLPQHTSTQQSADSHNVIPPSNTMNAHKQKEVKAFFGRTQETAQDSISTYKEKPKHCFTLPKKSQNMSSYAHVPDEMRVRKSSMKNIAILFILGAVVACVAIVVFVFLPRVTVALTPVIREESVTVNVTADVTQAATAFDKKRISLISLEKEGEKTMTFDATGTSTAGSYKARGSVTIYNNYSAQSQKLVATTRLLTKDGTLFRLVNGATVPGMRSVDGKVIPGSITVDVIADQAGDTFNIAPSTFTIPGFKGSSRYTKFSAKSDTAMMGGSTEGGSQAVVTKEDLENAKRITQEEAIKNIKEQLTVDARAQNKKVLDDAIHAEVVSSSTQVVDGVAAAAFDYTVHVTARGLIFSESDISLMITKTLEKNVEEQNMSPQNIVLTYSPVLADFDKQTLELKVRGTARLMPSIDTVAVRSALAGKKKDEIDSVLSEFDGIEQAELRYNMGFLMGRLPWYKGSITVIVEE